MVQFTGMASHLHPPREKEGDEYLARVSWWRPPYVASFRSGNFDFVIAAAHIRWGNGVGPRATEIGMLADWAIRYAAAPRTVVRDVLLVGDFNVPSIKSETFRVLTERGIAIPEAVAGVFGTDLAQGKRYDQILAVPHKLTDAFAFHRSWRRGRLLRWGSPRALSSAQQDGIHVRDERPLTAVGRARVGLNRNRSHSSR